MSVTSEPKPETLAKPVSATLPDWDRERPQQWWDPSRKLLRSIRRYQSLKQTRTPWAGIARKWWVLEHRFWSVITQAEISLNADIGGGLLMPHTNGIVIHPAAKIGPNCIIFQQVTIGVRSGFPDVPDIGGHVDIGAGAKILGPIRIGDHSAIGANAVVTRDVPARAVATGIPAQIKRNAVIVTASPESEITQEPDAD